MLVEIESGLEPHGLRHFVRLVRRLTAEERGQVIVTIHSEVAIVELTTAELSVVASTDGVTEVPKVHADGQAVVRAAPEALVATRSNASWTRRRRSKGVRQRTAPSRRLGAV